MAYGVILGQGSGGKAALTAVVTLTVEGWIDSTQKATSEIFKTGEQYIYTVSPTPEDIQPYSVAGIKAIAVNDSGMTFTYLEKPTKPIHVNVSMVEARS